MFLFLKLFSCISVLNIHVYFVFEQWDQGHECNFEDRTKCICEKEVDKIQSNSCLAVGGANLILFKYSKRSCGRPMLACVWLTNFI